MGEWLPVDEAADPGDDGLVLASDGLRQRRQGRLTVVPWDRVLGVERVRWHEVEILYVMTARRPPHAPWIEVTAAELPDGFADLAALERALEGRIRQVAWRGAGRPRARMSLEELREAVMARADVDGMVEVPIGPGPESGGLPFELTLFSLLWAPPLVALFLAVTGAMLIAVMAAPALIREPATGLVLGAAILVLSYALVGIAYLRQRWRRRPARASPGRVLVLAPDGFVIGTRQGVLTFSWSDAELGTRRTPRGGWALAVAERGAIVAEVEAEWLEAPLSLVVAVAKAYRERIGPG